MEWFFAAGALAVVVLAGAAALAARRVVIRLARSVVRRPRRRPVRIHGSTESSVTMDADVRTLHRGQFGLWFGDEGHAVVGRAREHDRSSGTVTRELLHVRGDLGAAEQGFWTGHVHPGPDALRREHREVPIAVPGGVAPAWRIAPARQAAPRTWAVHVHGWGTTRVTALRSVPATDALGMTSLVVSFRGDGEGPEPPGRASALGQDEWEDVDAAIGFARDNGAERVVLVGWSLGGAIALQLSERSAHRDVLDGLVLIGPMTDWRAAIHAGAAVRRLPRWTAEAAIRVLGDRRASARVGLSRPIDFDRMDWTRPGRLTVPALVLHSEGDRTVPLSSSLLFAMANPSLVRLVELSPAEHCWEYNVDPAAFNRAIIDFLDPG